MSVETRLRDAMSAAVAPVDPDTDHLVSMARRRGLGIRRRRQVLASVGVVAAVGLAALSPFAIARDGDARRPAADAGPTGQRGLDPDATTRFTGRSTAAALLYATLEVAPGGLTSRFAWQEPTDDETGETYARFLLFSPRGEKQPGEVAINVQPGFTGDAARDVRRCSDWMRHCRVDRRPDGSVMVTYEDVSSYGSGGYRRVASLLRADDVRVVVAASNGIDVTERDEQVTRNDPALTTSQLVAIASQSWWGPDLPTYFARSGAKLHGEEIPGSIQATPNAPTK